MGLGTGAWGEASMNRKSHIPPFQRIHLTNNKGTRSLAMQPLLCLGIRSLGRPRWTEGFQNSVQQLRLSV
jgi:hypothetical protein